MTDLPNPPSNPLPPPPGANTQSKTSSVSPGLVVVVSMLPSMALLLLSLVMPFASFEFPASRFIMSHSVGPWASGPDWLLGIPVGVFLFLAWILNGALALGSLKFGSDSQRPMWIKAQALFGLAILVGVSIELFWLVINPHDLWQSVRFKYEVSGDLGFFLVILASFSLLVGSLVGYDFNKRHTAKMPPPPVA